MKLGFIGLGKLGKAIAQRLSESGYELTGWNRTVSKAEGLDIKLVASPKEVAEKTDIIFTCLFDSNAVSKVLTQQDGLLSGDLSGKTIIDLTTNHFKAVPAFHEQCAQAGAIYLESPVAGSVVPALQGALTILVSGNKEAFMRVKPILDLLGKHIFFLETPGMATKMKLINNLALGSFMATLAEALAFGEDIGLGKETILDILSVGGGNSMVLNAKKGKLLTGDFSSHFSNALIYKDLSIMQELAYELKKPLFAGAVLKETYARTFQKGFENEDFSSVYKLFKP